jgi:plastocyanin
MIVGFVVQKAGRRPRAGRVLILAALLTMLVIPLAAGYSATPADWVITGTISLQNAEEDDPSNVAVWLEPLVGQPRPDISERLAINQRNKEFVPRVVIATPGQQIDFPNNDPFPHNIFSNSEVKRFDLGIYQPGESRGVTVAHPGIIPVYCNIHPEMEAFIVVVQTPYYAISNDRGEIQIKNVPPGHYRLKVWHERAKQKTLDALTRKVVVNSSGANLGNIKIDETGYQDAPHKNKLEKDYTVYPDK